MFGCNFHETRYLFVSFINSNLFLEVILYSKKYASEIMMIFRRVLAKSCALAACLQNLWVIVK